MKPNKQFKPQNLRSLLIFIFIIISIAGGVMFYLGLGMMKEYSAEVNQRLVDADASGKQIEELQTLKSQLSQSNSLVEKANQLFATPDTYRSQTLTDIKNYADRAGLTLESTKFDDTSQQTVVVKLSPPVSYTKLIAFLSNVESNLPKLQVSSVSLDHVADGSADAVGVGEIKIDISVR